MFVYPFRRLVKSTWNNTRGVVVRDNSTNYSATAPLMGITENTPTTRAKAQQENITYYSIPAEFP